MNKIVIIGNGFDLAHGLPTRYEDFMNYLKNSIAQKDTTNTYKRILGQGYYCGEDGRFIHRRTEDGQEDPWIGIAITDSNDLQFKANPHPHAKPKSIYFKSLFQEHDSLGNWSDLEYHYFRLLNSYKHHIESIITINKEFEHIKKLLNHYLKTEIEDKVGVEYKIDDNNSIFQKLGSETKENKFDNYFFVTFNYTGKILLDYVLKLRSNFAPRKIPMNPIHIHGGLINSYNPMIFGYGDDNSNEYKELQNTKQNELLKNFKTFQYLRSKRYRQVLRLLEETDDIYVQIIGHSCDICDKALLRTIFQHPNVKQIEATYHESEERYFENLYNISRIFDDNTLMREKIIPLDDTFKIE